MNSLEISKMLTISTGHLTEDDAVYLERASSRNDLNGLIVYKKGDCGWFVYVTDEIEDYQLSENLKHLLTFAKDLECYWLCFDRDGDMLEYLPIYDW